MSHIPLVRFPRARKSEHEARRPKRRFAAVWRAYEKGISTPEAAPGSIAGVVRDGRWSSVLAGLSNSRSEM
jgi:hypothetical protein